MANTINQTIKFKDVDFNKLTFSDLYKIGRGQNVYINYGGKKPLYMQLPELEKRFELSKHENEYQKDGQTIKTAKFECALNLDQADPKQQEIIAKLQEFDEQIINQVKQNSHQYLRQKNATLDGLRALYTPVLRFSKARENRDEDDGKYVSIKVRLPYKEDKFNTIVFDENKELVESENIEGFMSVPGQVRAIIKPQSIWITGGKFGTIWEAVKMSVKPGETAAGEVGFVHDSDEEETNVVAPDTSAAEVDDADTSNAETAEDTPQTETVEETPSASEVETTEADADNEAEGEDAAAVSTEETAKTTKRGKGNARRK